jgi:hypothetical protein
MKDSIKMLSGAVAVYAVLLTAYWVPQLIK